MPDCPHCQVEITSLSGFIAQADLESRLKSLKEGKNSEIAALTARVSEYGAKASGYDAVVAERDSLKQANEARGLRDERTTLLAAASVDPALLSEIEQVYSWSQNGVADDAKKPFEQWFGDDAASHVLLSPHFNAAPVGNAAPPPSAPPVGDGVNRVPPSRGAPPPPPSGGKITEQDLANYMASPAYQNLPTSTEKRAKMTEWSERIAAQG